MIVNGKCCERKPMSEREKRQRKPAIGYTRTSSAANVGEDKDSLARQRKAIQAGANWQKRLGPEPRLSRF
jgi:hypothetical protein